MNFNQKDMTDNKVENTEETRTPAYMLFAVKEEQHLLIRKALYLQNKYSVFI